LVERYRYQRNLAINSLCIRGRTCRRNIIGINKLGKPVAADDKHDAYVKVGTELISRFVKALFVPGNKSREVLFNITSETHHHLLASNTARTRSG
jgi:hypothetical protein